MRSPRHGASRPVVLVPGASGRDIPLVTESPPFEIVPTPCLQDNYAYVIATDRGHAWVVDPSEVGPPASVLEDRGLILRGVLATHHHWDHTAGIGDLVARCGDADTVVAGHASDVGRIEGMTHGIEAPTDRYVASGLFLIPGVELRARHIPGHTTGAIAWLIPGEPAPDVFTGDTLFAAGCGRLFEGTAAQMHTSLQALTQGLPAATRLWFGHEYTAANLRFAAAAEPDNEAVRRRQEGLGERTTPTTVMEELATNPFVRAGSAEALADRRQAKDNFRAP